jgi:hypothetical protein
MKKGQTLMLSLLFAIFIFIFGMIIMNFLKLDVTTARTSLQCSDPANISDGVKLACLFVDGVIPYFILLVVSISGGILLDRLLI